MLVNALLDANRLAPRALAVDDGIYALTYRRLTRLACVLRGIVAKQTQCERVGIMLPASSIFPAALFGVLWSSRVAVPLNFLLNADELAAVVANADLDLILTVRHFANLSAKLPARSLFLDELPLKRKTLLAMLRRLPPPPPAQAHQTAVILYTSGTTAQPKGVELTFGNLYSNCVDVIEMLRIDSRQKFLNMLPPFHVFGLTACVLIPVVLRAGVYAIPRFSPVAAVKAVSSQGISILLAIPSMYAAMLRTKSAGAESFRSVFLAMSGGEPLSENVRLGFEQRLGITLHQGYGLTETSPVISVSTPAAYRMGSVGRPIPNVEVRVVDGEGREVAPGKDGEILARGPGVMKGYFRQPEETRRVLDEHGWLSTGDLGHVDIDGYLTITGRQKEMLIIGGENVYAREIESVLETHDTVLQAAVIGIPDDVRGETPAAFVIPRPGRATDEAELRTFARQTLAGFKVPRRILIREDLPRGPTGKILKRRLRELL